MIDSGRPDYQMYRRGYEQCATQQMTTVVVFNKLLGFPQHLCY